MKKSYILTLSLLSFFFFSCEKAIVTKYATDFISTDNNPVQIELYDEKTITISNDSGEFSLTPLAEYTISARVMSTEHYSRKWTSSLSPVDLALAWGELATVKMDDYISYKQRNRWYFYKYKPDCPVDNNYIISHSSNNHIIPSSHNLSVALKNIKKHDTVKITGLLVKVSGMADGQKVSWGTSTTRNDTGDRSCELIYAKEIRINDKVYN